MRERGRKSYNGLPKSTAPRAPRAATHHATPCPARPAGGGTALAALRCTRPPRRFDERSSR
ncbi:hypothetical protein BOC40_25405 [Burkholderia pseudomallei]|nr:hypothetical protein BOC36_21235 [Burkholderia pseudomallei]ARK59326.1 hypothetical protein BOC37_04600 [Burkholderia pseudomallei]ARK70565.1 hypothetical protein BOC38_28790 [Burkholderia pseudomallei]ARK83670.1 hypothetical protein BOC40_25405 [Burkholderia pseudomallei]ARK91669.1 hypothetical protein BOC42_31590 [Burkholderia pseudomallei]